jgi:DNA-binding transcriptional MerR regulator
MTFEAKPASVVAWVSFAEVALSGSRSAWDVAYTMYLGTESSMAEAKLTIGRIAHAAGVNVETVRYYQRRGLVSLPPKRMRGFRYYTPGTASRVRFIKRAQALGMSLKEVQRLLRLDAKGACKETRALAVANLAVDDGHHSNVSSPLRANSQFAV